jgi:hypothetical protein
MEATGYWPAELALDAGIIYLLKNSKNPWEIFFLVLALCVHIPRQIREWPVIKETSSKKSLFFLFGILAIFILLVQQMRVRRWPIPVVIAIVLGILYVFLTNKFVKDSGRKFNLYIPWIDVPQLFISGIMSWIAFKTKNPVSILWVADFVYHVLQMPLRV